jgi:hypothetical protein
MEFRGIYYLYMSSKMLRSVKIHNYIQTIRLLFEEYNIESTRFGNGDRVLRKIDKIFADYFCSLFAKERKQPAVQANILYIYNWLLEISSDECADLFDLVNGGFNSEEFNLLSCDSHYIDTCWNICEFVRSCRNLAVTKLRPKNVSYIQEVVPIIFEETPLCQDVICEILSFLKYNPDDIITRREIDTIVYATVYYV